ncbi:MAG: RidA family protein [Pseudomonadota bacterium]|nr:RidA family protein [Pseudomonadota bacterium]
MVTRTNINADTIFTRKVDGKAMFPHAVSIEGKRLICLSGQLAWDKDGNTVGPGDMRAQFRQVGENIKAALEAAGAGLEDLIKTNTYVTDMDEFFKCVDIRGEYFGPGFPCSTTVEISCLADPDAMIEIEAIAVVDA